MAGRDVLIQRALEVYRNVPEWGIIYLSREDCLLAVGMTEDVAAEESVKRQLDRLCQGSEQRYGRLKHINEFKDNVSRAVYLAQRIVTRPDTMRKAPLAYVMEVAGFEKRHCGPGKEYMKVSRDLAKIKKGHGNSKQSAPAPPSAAPAPPTMGAATVISQESNSTDARRPTIEIDLDVGGVAPHSVISPLTTECPRPSQSTASVITIDDEEQEDSPFMFHNLPPPTYCRPFKSHVLDAMYNRDDTVASSGTVNLEATNISWREARKRPANINSSIHHLTTTTSHRRTTQAAQIERQSQREIDNIRKSMYKAGTVICNSVKMKQNTLRMFRTPDQVASSLNNLIGIDCLSGRELAAAVRQGNINKSPPRLGRKGEVPEEVFKAFCTAVFTACAIEQANCKDRSTREELKSTVGEILNNKRSHDGLDEMSDAKFYNRIEREICHLQDLNKADTRESLRVLWLTYQAQLKHYINWEATAVELGFARELTEAEKPEQVGHIVWHKERLHCVLQFDEMNIALDGADASIGGRQSRIPTSTSLGLADSGQATEKSGASMTIMFGVNFAGEALPPLFIFPSAAKNPDNYKMKVDFAMALPQLKARYGFDEERYHNVPFAMNPKGGMNKEMLHSFFRTCVLPLYPKCADNKRDCLLTKIDSGPGRSNPSLLRTLRSYGAHLYPGLPNGTEVGQECDQLFAFMKKLVYQNRDKLWSARFRLEGETASLSMSDVAAMVFGGPVTLIDGSTVNLVDAFAEAMDPAHIHAAMDKCGYCPSTRAALEATQIRHEVIETEDGSIDAEADPYGTLLDELETQNTKACQFLRLEGYSLADNLVRTVSRVTSEQSRGRAATMTIRNTRERQDAIQAVSTAGGWFHVTNGGGPMTCDDALIAFARKDMAKAAEELEKRRKDCSQVDDTAAAAERIVASGKDSSQWKKSELQVMIRWKQGVSPAAPYNDNVNVNKPVLVKLWNEKYRALEAPASNTWTEDDDDELERLLSGEITNFSQDVGLDHCMETEDDYLATRLLSINESRRRKVLLRVMKEIGTDKAYDIVTDV